jgi:hypothetical protein
VSRASRRESYPAVHAHRVRPARGQQRAAWRSIKGVDAYRVNHQAERAGAKKKQFWVTPESTETPPTADAAYLQAKDKGEAGSWKRCQGCVDQGHINRWK